MKALIESRAHADVQRSMQQIKPYRPMQALWLALASSILLTATMLMGAIQPGTTKVNDDFHLWYLLLTNFVSFWIIYLYIFYIVRIRLPLVQSRSLGIGGILLIAGLTGLGTYITEENLYGKGATSYNLTVMLLYYLTAATIAYLIVVLMTSLTRYQRALVEAEHLQAENMLIRYETLERQVSPHFLFNSLNTLDGLIGTDDSRAHTYLHHLATIFRYSMQKEKVVTLQEELTFSKSYIYMMQIRYGDNLVVEEHIDPQLLDTSVVPISLQLLLENSIKHNVVSNRHPLHISIATTAQSTLKVGNPIQPKVDTEESLGIGLSNLQQRYSLLFQKNISISRTDNYFEVEIPLIPPSEAQTIKAE